MGAALFTASSEAILDVSIPGEPVGKGRPRVVTKGKGGRALPFARTFTPAKTEAWEDRAVAAFLRAHSGAPLDEPLVLVVEAVAARGKALLPKERGGNLSARAVREDPAVLNRRWRVTKPDGDNVLKCVADALVSAGVVRDDTRIVDWRLLSLTAALDEGPSVRVVVSRAGACS